ncbi:hypothetical protein [Acinetobacter courvalinii]|uniref:hypothetical protein n=1 Tax=Acinetobacter courvalinii TaxID=280147 RepID=UPI00289D3C63|nr:hypothetical protein [Acinetobacter courvalinii]
MKRKREFFLAVLLWTVVSYAISLLIYCTMKNLIGFKPDFISAFGSILGAIATFFAALVAIYIFNGWRNQHNKSIIANEAKLTFNKIHLERNKIHEMKFMLLEIQSLNPRELPLFKGQIIKKIEELEHIHNSNNQPTNEFTNLIEDSKLHDLICKYSDHLESFANIKYSEMEHNFEVYAEITDIVLQAENNNQDVLQELKTYIFA